MVILAGALAFLAICEAVGYRRWVRPLGSRATPGAIVAIGIMVLTLAGGFFGAFSRWFDVTESFAWDLPPLGGRMLASAG